MSDNANADGEDVELLEKRIEMFEARGWENAAETNREKLAALRGGDSGPGLGLGGGKNDPEHLCEQIEKLEERGWENAAETKRDRLEALTGERDPAAVDFDALTPESVPMEASDEALGLADSHIEKKIQRLKKRLRQKRSSSFLTGDIDELEAEIARLEEISG